ncbi:FAD-dependent monooxygenase [Nocardia australiensis]|uniref:FAD-dependent monooxygenase n=1 Tax=Nocardia australiensis TaxID=2887191 RepID=UPI001D1436E9|nr:FAD-dependent monooxygenase [Nocardia australiensis]
MNSAETDVLVVGAGPTGLVLACALRLQGVAVRVVDAASGPATTSRANILHARGAEVLERIGALGDLPQRSLTALTITQYLDGKPAVTVRFGDLGPGTTRPALYASQADVEAQLRRRLGELGTDIEWNSAISGSEQNDSGVTTTLTSGDTLRCRWMVGCDGAHSAVRKLAGIAFPGARLTERFLLADVYAEWPVDRSGGHGWPHRDGPLFAVPMREAGRPDDLWRLMAYDPTGSDDAQSTEQIVDRFRQLVPERTGRTDIRITDASWTSVFHVHRRLADTYRDRRVFLAGDAAHIHSPLGGQGIVTGIGDAENLAWKLALVIEGRATTALLDTYEAERRPLATDVLRNTTTATRLQVGDSPFLRFLRRRLLVPIAAIPAVQRRASRVASQLWVTYRQGPLSRGIRSHLGRPPRPGDRIPNLPSRHLDGSRTDLYSQLGKGWVLLLPSHGDAVPFTAIGALLGHNVIALVSEPTTEQRDVRLIRPDAHLAWRGTEPRRLTRWLEHALQCGTATP